MEKEIINYPRIHGVAITDRDIPSVFPSHWHNAAELSVILNDGCRYKIGDEIVCPKKDDILMIWPRELHKIIYHPKNSSLFIQFSSRIMESNTDLVAAARFLNACHLIPYEKEPEVCKKIASLIYKIRDIHDKNQYFSETRCKILVYEILVLAGDYVMQEHRIQIGDERFSDKAWGYVRDACAYIAEHSSENITQADVAETVGLSPFYFSKIFHEYTQRTFPSYLAGIRIQNVLNLLENENHSITECAFAAGFQSTTTFNKIFMEFTGCSPREYRKMHSRIR